MKTLLVMLLAQVVLACPPGTTPYRDTCTIDAPDAEPQKPVVPDDVKPPRGVQPAWETGSVKVLPAVVATDSATVHDDPDHPRLITK